MKDDTNDSRAPLFHPGRIVATPGAIEALGDDSALANAVALLDRHIAGDWGAICQEDSDTNARALARGGRLMSVYEGPDGAAIWIITEADRSATTLLLPDEY